MEKLLHVSSSPHARCNVSTRTLMLDVVLALMPATVFGICRFGLYALCILVVSVGFSVLTEYVFEVCTGRKVTIRDGSALVTGLLIGLNMPPEIPLWMPMLGSIFAILIVKQIFGGIGQNFMNPAMAARCFLLISFAGKMTTFTSVDTVSGATPLTVLKNGGTPDPAAMFTGMFSGSIGEISVIALLAGGIYLLVKRVIDWRIPVIYIGTFAVFVILFGGRGVDPVYLAAHLCGGGLMLGAWFMATDYVTSPITSRGKVIYAVLLGILTGVFRLFGGTAEGVSYAILLGNLLVPLIERVTIPKAFGWEGRKHV